MKRPKFEAAEVARWIQDLTDQEFVTFFYSHLGARHIYRAERRYIDSSLVLANSKRTCEEGQYPGPWELELIAPAPQETWHKDAPLCQFGTCAHCGHKTVSISKVAACPLCQEFVYGS